MAERYATEVAAARELPTRLEMAELGRLALQIRNENFLVQDTNCFKDSHIAADSILLPTSPFALDLTIAINGARMRYPEFSVTTEETFPTTVPERFVRKTIMYEFMSPGQSRRGSDYKCSNAFEAYEFMQGEEVIPFEQPAQTVKRRRDRRARKEIQQLEQIWGTSRFRKDQYNRLRFIMQEFDPARAIVGDPDREGSQ